MTLLVLLASGNAAWAADWYMRKMAADRMTQSVLARMEQDVLFQAVKDADPGTYRQIVRIVDGTRIYPADERPRRADDLVKPMLSSLMRSKVATLNDHMMVQTAHLVRDRMAERIRISPQSCDRAPMGNVLRIESVRGDDTMKERMMRHYADIIRSEPAPSTARRASPAEVAALMAGSTMSWLMQSGITSDQLRTETAPPGTRCRMIMALFDAIVAMPEADGGAYMRGFVAIAKSTP